MNINNTILPDDDEAVSVVYYSDFIFADGLSGKVYKSKLPEKCKNLEINIVESLEEKKIKEWLELMSTAFQSLMMEKCSVVDQTDGDNSVLEKENLNMMILKRLLYCIRLIFCFGKYPIDYTKNNEIKALFNR